MHHGRWRAHGDPLKVVKPFRATAVDGLVECARCSERKAVDEYRRSRFCRACLSEVRYEYKTLRPLGVTWDQYKALLDWQGGACAACRRTPAQCGPAQARRRLSLDHNHRTGTPRGLLCRTCNQALGVVDDDVHTLLALADYLEAYAV
jgi:hypothetical protein